MICIHFQQALSIINSHLLIEALKRYKLEDYTAKPVSAHEGGRNIIFFCQNNAGDEKVLRFSFCLDRSKEDFLAEVEFIAYLHHQGCSVANIIPSCEEQLVEELLYDSHTFYCCLFEKAQGKLLVENHYQYRENTPIEEYYYNCGRVLGKIHQASKSYAPVHQRYSFFDKFNHAYIDSVIPEQFVELKQKIKQTLEQLMELDTSKELYGMVHFDFNDGNYNIDFSNGQITVYDFDNACYCWYVYDLADLWTHGVGWVQFEPDSSNREAFMQHYFNNVLEGYRSETQIDNNVLELLPLFINVTLVENILDTFDVMQREDEVEIEEDLLYLITCLVDDIPYKGFFSSLYSHEHPFEL